jgi:hypothetical protein
MITTTKRDPVNGKGLIITRRVMHLLVEIMHLQAVQVAVLTICGRERLEIAGVGERASHLKSLSIGFID